jgi:hypothetical protein
MIKRHVTVTGRVPRSKPERCQHATERNKASRLLVPNTFVPVFQKK